MNIIFLLKTKTNYDFDNNKIKSAYYDFLKIIINKILIIINRDIQIIVEDRV